MPHLSDIPNGADVFIDANILIYGLSGRSQQCRELLERVAREDVFGITSYLVVSEATHKLMLAEFQAKGGSGSANPRKYLKEHPAVAAALTQYWIEAQKILAMNLVFLDLGDEIISSAQPIRKATGLLNNDSLIAASMQYLGVTSIASNDADFGNVTGFSVFKPSDI